MSEVLKKHANNMADNIESMESLMTIFDCELYELEHLLLCLGDCYYYDIPSKKVIEAYTVLTADDVGGVDIQVILLSDEHTGELHISAEEAYYLLSKDADELGEINGVKP